MSTANPATIRLADYTPPPWLIESVELDVDIGRDATLVTASLRCARNPAAAGKSALVLDGDRLETLGVSVDGRALPAGAYTIDEKTLRVEAPADEFTLTTRVRLQPDHNSQLSGLYRSRDGLFTQCEAQGFRRITWFADRPDVMSRYKVTIHAERDEFPVLLANGNPIAAGIEPAGRHYAIWQDPFKKPCYLFALVAGKLDVLRDAYRTAGGRDVQLAIYVEPGKLDQCAHAMAALKKSMRWDEERFGLECDLDHYMIVAVGDFNMGAMENKGLNIFNTKYVLARAEIATDTDFENIDRVVAHEYFHNWTGNRVTCRDWFQLSLKEGLTVYRDQEFGADTHSRQTARIREVRGLRAAQFPEDAGPLAHPVRPSSYLEINNFYTATVYEKGAEVVRMIATLIGTEAFRRGMDLYFARHDGQAVTCDDFVAAMAAASGFDFTQFMAWYSRAGTPRVLARGAYDAAQQRYTLTFRQTPGAAAAASAEAAPYLIPVAVGLIAADGSDVDLGSGRTSALLTLTQAEQSFVFENIETPPVPSLLRNFSAPVVLDYAYGEAELAHLLAHDSDPFNRWEAGQRLFGELILRDAASGAASPCPPAVLAAARRVLRSASDPAFAAEALTLPGEATLAEQMERVDPERLHAARNALSCALASALESDLLQLYEELAPRGAYSTQTAAVGARRLRNLCLALLNEIGSERYRALALRQFENADNMTDQFAALSILANAAGGEGEAALAAFYARWRDEALVVDKWFAVQAGSRLPGMLARVEALTRHPAFDLRNPNKVYALLRSFGANHLHFHAADGAGYRFMGEQIAVLDASNPQVAARLARAFDRWRRFDAGRQAQARAVLETLRARAKLSRDVFEVVDKALA